MDPNQTIKDMLILSATIRANADQELESEAAKELAEKFINLNSTKELKSGLILCTKILQSADEGLESIDSELLAEKFIALNRWIDNNGFLPTNWNNQ
jgi:hypothetical protein